MYTVAINNLALSSEFSPLLYLSNTMLWIAVFTWILVFAALMKSLLKKAHNKGNI